MHATAQLDDAMRRLKVLSASLSNLILDTSVDLNIACEVATAVDLAELAEQHLHTAALVAERLNTEQMVAIGTRIYQEAKCAQVAAGG